jgi:beta-mannosidase
MPIQKIYDLSDLQWRVSGCIPYQWEIAKNTETGIGTQDDFEISSVPARVPGSVQKALLDAGHIPDWNKGLNARSCEWVENRHWIYETVLPDEWIDSEHKFHLKCLGLDYRGRIMLNGREVGGFDNVFVPWEYDLTPFLKEADNTLRIIFELSPRWLGQIYFTSRIKDWKERFNYHWDWTSRLVQIGIWDSVYLVNINEGRINTLKCTTDVNAASKKGLLNIKVGANIEKNGGVRISLEGAEGVIREERLRLRDASEIELLWDDLPIQLWWPNGLGDQILYSLKCELFDPQGRIQDRLEKRIGFKHVEWRACEGAPEQADPWLCVVNGREIFLQGVNWTPIRPNFADLKKNDYHKRLELYKKMGCNMMRVWGGGVLEKEWFYDLCDEFGLLVWQEFPLSSSGIDNWPPENPEVIDEITAIARSYISRRQHHVSLTLWCGGNELQGDLEGRKTGGGKPVDSSHPLIKALEEVVKKEDPLRRFLPTSSSGPRFFAEKEDFGKGLHWDVHGPWILGGNFPEWEDYWRNDDALFRSETGVPGASSPALIREFKGACSEFPASKENPLWRRSIWWVEWDKFMAEIGRAPESLEEYVEWSQNRQAEALKIAVAACKKRFPRCGGILIWMGHDSFPCTANTSIVDFHGDPKPAAMAIAEIFRTDS